MQIILLLLLTTFAFAQKSLPGNQCDPVEAEKECYNLLCTNTPKKIIPMDATELTKAYQAHPYVLHPDIAKDVEKLATVSEAIKATAKKAIDNGDLDKMADELTETPVETMYLLQELYKGDFQCIQKNRKCDLIASDMTNHSPEMKNFFRKLHDATYFFRESIIIPMEYKKDYLTDLLNEMTGIIPTNVIKTEKKKLGKLKREIDFMLYTMEAPWLKEYKKKMIADLKPFQKVLSESLKAKMTELMQVDLSSAEAKAKVAKSCQLASFVKTSIDQNVSPEKFTETKMKVIDSFKTKFLPGLSVSSGKELSGILKPEVFNLIEEDVNINPFTPPLGRHREGYIPPQNNYEVLKDLTLLPRGMDHRCQIKGLMAKDVFNFGTDQVFVSKYVLGNSYNDAVTHELGHWLSNQMKQKNMSSRSRKKLLNVRECVTDFYPSEKAKSTYAINHKGDRLRTEEDFADWFTAKSGLGENGLFCDLKKMLVNFIGAKEQNSYLPHKEDSHSNFLFREITLRLNRGETLPQSCKDLVDSYPESKPQKCDF